MLHVISTGKQPFEQWLAVTKQIHHDADFVHIREKTWSTMRLEKAVQALLKAEVPASKIIINNQPELVKKLELAGTHFPESTDFSSQASFYKKGSSVHGVAAARQKEEEGADYLFFGHVYDTASKPELPARGLRKLQQTAEAVSIPVIAIGGITPERVPECLAAGAAGVAGMSGMYEVPDPVAAVQSYRLALSKGGML